MDIRELSGSNKIITSDESISYKIISGSVELFLLPVLEDHKQLRFMYIGHAEEGMLIPAMNCEHEFEGQPARFMLLISSESGASLQVLSENSKDYQALLSAIGYQSTSNDLIQDYIDRYHRENDMLVKNIEYSNKSIRRDEKLILSAFDEKLYEDTDEDVSRSDFIYRAVAFLGQRYDFKLAGIRRIKSIFGEDYSVAEIAEASDFLCRKVDLQDKWYKMDFSPCICFDADDNPYAVYIDRWGRKRFYDPRRTRSMRLTAQVAKSFGDMAYCIHRPLNDKKLDIQSITKFVMKDYSFYDLVGMLIMMSLITVVNVQVGSITQTIYDGIIPQGSLDNLIGYGGILIMYTLGSVFFTLSQNVANLRQNSRIKYTLQAAIYNRVFHMPENFYRKYDAGEITYRCSSAASSYYSMFNAMTQIILQASFSIMYYLRMKKFSPELGKMVLLYILIGMVLSVAINTIFITYQRKKAHLTGKLKAMLFQFFTGIKTVRSAGAENAVASEYLKKFAEWNVYDYNHGKAARLLGVKNTVISTIIMYQIYVAASRGHSYISTGTFLAFIAMYGSFSHAMLSVTDNISMMYTMIPLMKNATSLLKTPPELCGDGRIPPRLKGDIRIKNLCFGYSKNLQVLKGINLEIKSGEYVAIVGATGCGKSTLLRLLLGFEEPQMGKISYDRYDLQSLNKPQFRKRVRVVLQDGGLFAGSIYKNIKLSNPDATMEEINAAIEAVGLKEDIDNMPMGIMTPVSEEASTVSGGQKQRILIARAIVGNPDILFLDEATSSLDNVAQARVIEAIEKLKATRIVVAHRLSTVINCDRIIVIDNGVVKEQGKYEELLQSGGIFSQLVKNQML